MSNRKRIVKYYRTSLVIDDMNWLVFALPNIGFNPLGIATFPAEWWPLIILLALPGLLLTELEEFLVGLVSKNSRKYQE